LIRSADTTLAMANVRCLSSPGRTIRDDLIPANNHGPTARMLPDVKLNGSTENTSKCQMVPGEVERTTATSSA
jgi:hypothetical protein